MPERRLDLGCGAKSRQGFIGLDRFAIGGAYVVADLDRAMREVWRVGRPGDASVCIVAPYHTLPPVNE